MKFCEGRRRVTADEGRDSGLQLGDTEGCLSGNTVGVVQIQDCDAVRIVR